MRGHLDHLLVGTVGFGCLSLDIVSNDVVNRCLAGQRE